MSKFKKMETPVKDLFIIEPTVFGDARGFFMESYSKKDFKEIGLEMEFIQDNHSKSKKGVLRGLHLQTRFTQGKLVRVTRGSVWDVAVDLREGSETFGKWYGLLLSEENKRMFYVPEGFAHGFVTLEDDTEFQYKCTDYYAPEFDAGIIWNDETVGIEWPFEEYGIKMEELLISGKDQVLPKIEDRKLFEK